jgi:hypothetical protein
MVMVLTGDYTRVAATWTRVQRIIRGLDDTVHSFGIMTAWNPTGQTDQKLTRNINEEANARLIKKFRERPIPLHPLGAISIQGTFPNVPEESFLIPNVSRTEMVSWCRKFKQWGVIYAERFSDPEDEKVRYRYELIDSRGRALAKPQTAIFTSGDKIGEDYVRDLLINYSSMGKSKPKIVEPGETAPIVKKFKVNFP